MKGSYPIAWRNDNLVCTKRKTPNGRIHGVPGLPNTSVGTTKHNFDYTTSTFSYLAHSGGEKNDSPENNSDYPASICWLAGVDRSLQQCLLKPDVETTCGCNSY
jgi:hypothetical protein